MANDEIYGGFNDYNDALDADDVEGGDTFAAAAQSSYGNRPPKVPVNFNFFHFCSIFNNHLRLPQIKYLNPDGCATANWCCRGCSVNNR